MTREELTQWALANGWREMAGVLCLTKPSNPNEPIVRLVFKATVATVEVKKPAGKWEKFAATAYAQITMDDEHERPLGLGFEKIPSFSMLMRDNKDRQVFGKFGK